MVGILNSIFLKYLQAEYTNCLNNLPLLGKTIDLGFQAVKSEAVDNEIMG